MKKGTSRLAKHKRARRQEWLLATLTDVARLESRLGLLDEQDRADFYGHDYLEPDQKLDRLLKAATAGT